MQLAKLFFYLSLRNPQREVFCNFNSIEINFLRIPCSYLIQIMEASPRLRYPTTNKAKDTK